MVLDHSERFPLTGLLSLSAILPTTWEGPSGCSIGAACCRSLTHSWALTLLEVAPSLLEKLKWLHHLNGLWTTLLPVLKAGWKLPQAKRCLARTSHACSSRQLKRQADNCRGTSLAHCYLYCVSINYAHSRGKLIIAVGPLTSPLQVLKPTRHPTQETTLLVAWRPSHHDIVFAVFVCIVNSFCSTYLTILLFVVDISLSFIKDTNI